MSSAVDSKRAVPGENATSPTALEAAAERSKFRRISAVPATKPSAGSSGNPGPHPREEREAWKGSAKTERATSSNGVPTSGENPDLGESGERAIDSLTRSLLELGPQHGAVAPSLPVVDAPTRGRGLSTLRLQAFGGPLVRVMALLVCLWTAFHAAHALDEALHPAAPPTPRSVLRDTRGHGHSLHVPRSRFSALPDTPLSDTEHAKSAPLEPTPAPTPSPSEGPPSDRTPDSSDDSPLPRPTIHSRHGSPPRAHPRRRRGPRHKGRLHGAHDEAKNSAAPSLYLAKWPSAR